MRRESRDQDRPARHGRALLLGALILAAGCGPAGPPIRSITTPVEWEEEVNLAPLASSSKTLQEYTDALLLCESPNRRDWDGARRKLQSLQPFKIFKEDPDLVSRFGRGDGAARVELGRRGRILRAMLAFVEPRDPGKWRAAHGALMAEGEVGRHLLVYTLLTVLQNGQFRNVWVHARFALVETGEMGQETTSKIVEELAEQTRSNPITNLDDLTQMLVALLGFGASGGPDVRRLAEHPTSNVRRAVARAIGEARDASSAEVMVALLSDSDWVVRATTAEAAGQMTPARAAVGGALLGRLREEPETFVQRIALRALGDIGYADAVPDVVRLLETPNPETANAAIYALYRITGEAYTRPEEWRKWYVERYPAWEAGRPK
jgi:hypothetical protein